MLSRSVIISLERFDAKTLSDLVGLQELLDYTVCYNITKYLNSLHYHHLPVFYRTQDPQFSLDTGKYPTTWLREQDHQPLSQFNVLLYSAVGGVVEEFNLHHRSAHRDVLNFNGCLINRSNFILCSDVLLGS